MEKGSKFSLIRDGLGILGLSLITIIHSGYEPYGAASVKPEETLEAFLPPKPNPTEGQESPVSSLKADLTGLINIPYFFEGCLILPQGWIGIGSVYTEAGCLGCSEDLKMANGERLSDQKPTFAAWRDELGSFYMLRNTENGLRAKGKLTDRGGFDILANPKPHKIADDNLAERSFDLSLALSAKLGHIQTGKKTKVNFYKLDCG